MTKSEQTRQQAVERLYVSNFGYIQELIYIDPASTLETEQKVTEGIVKNLPSYAGKPTDTEFRVWLDGIIAPVVGFHAIRRVCQPFVREAIWATLQHHLEPSKFDDYPELVRELEQEVWCWVFLHQDELRERGTAKITTRVYDRTEWMTKDWLKRQRERRFAVIRRVYNLPSKAKMKDAAMKMAAELDREAHERAELESEAKEIVDEMKKVGLAA